MREIQRSEKEEERIQQEIRKQKRKKKEEKGSWIKEILYYVCMVLFISILYIIQMDSSRGPKVIAGYSAYTVLSGSMQDEIPKDSFVLSKQVDAKELEIGDDITFMMGEKIVVTHRIVGIHEDYNGTGKRAFETKGTMNPENDEEEVIEENVVGKVIYHNYLMGVIILWIRRNWVVIFMWLIILYGLQKYYRRRSHEDEEEM